MVLSVRVDDVMVSGKKADVDDLKAKVKAKFGILDLGRVKKHLGMMYDWSEDEKGPYMKITMEKMLQTLLRSTRNMWDVQLKCQRHQVAQVKCQRRIVAIQLTWKSFEVLLGK